MSSHDSSAGGFDTADSHRIGAISIGAPLLADSVLTCSGIRRVEPSQKAGGNACAMVSDAGPPRFFRPASRLAP
jgi:hypothetical protein